MLKKALSCTKPGYTRRMPSLHHRGIEVWDTLAIAEYLNELKPNAHLLPADDKARAQADIDRILEIWRECFVNYGGPYLFGKKPGVADAMYAPVVTRLLTYDIALDAEF